MVLSDVWLNQNALLAMSSVFITGDKDFRNVHTDGLWCESELVELFDNLPRRVHSFDVESKVVV